MTQLYLPAPELVSVNLPFSGFYGTQWEGMVDCEVESFLEYFASPDNMDEETDRYRWLCSEKQVLGDLLFKHTTYRKAYEQIAREYADHYLWWLAESLGFKTQTKPHPTFPWAREVIPPVKWEFEEMVSPREYNFSTDRLFVKIDAVLLRELFRQVMLVDNSWAFDKAVKESFTSRDGFCSFYDNDPKALAAKPLADWDHNEVKTLLLAWEAAHALVADDIAEGLWSKAYEYFDAAVDWPAFDEACRAAVLDMLDSDELTELERYRLEHPRCPHTLELPL